MPTTVGVMEPPLGNTRLQITRLVMLLLATNRPNINAELKQLGTMQILIVSMWCSVFSLLHFSVMCYEQIKFYQSNLTLICIICLYCRT